MQLTHDGSRFIAVTTYAEKEIPRQAGFKWDAHARRWATQQPEVAARLKEFADAGTARMLDGVGATLPPAEVREPLRLGIDEDGFYRLWCYRDEREIAKQAGFAFDGTKARWVTVDADKARKLIHHADAATRVKLDQHAAEVEAALALSRATDSAVALPCPDGKEYRPFQRAGIAYGASKSGVLFGDEPGLGKTIQAIGVMNVDLDKLPEGTPYRALVICPSSLRLNWRNELQGWLIRELPIHVIEGGKASPAWEEVRQNSGVVIINYDVVAKHRAAIDAVEWDSLVVDEAHYLKNPKAARTKAIIGGKER